VDQGSALGGLVGALELQGGYNRRRERDCPAALLGLRLYQLEVSIESLQGVTDVKLAAPQVHILPAEAQGFALPKPQRDSDGYQRLVIVAGGCP